MMTVAVAGGTSPGLGRSILEALKEHPRELKPIVLSRQTSIIPRWLNDLDIEVRKVDCGSEGALVDALKGVSTCRIISTVGRFAAAACLLPFGSWKEDSSMAGETMKMDEVVRIVEEVKGEKMEVVYRDFETVVRKKGEEGHFYRKFWYELAEMMAREEVGESVLEPVLNHLCTDVKPTTVKEYVRKYWGPKN